MNYKLVKGNKISLKPGQIEEVDPVENCELVGDEEGISLQIQQFNKSLKEEKMINRLEKVMNDSSINLSENTPLLEYLLSGEYLRILALMVAKPHQYPSTVQVYIFQ